MNARAFFAKLWTVMALSALIVTCQSQAAPINLTFQVDPVLITHTLKLRQAQQSQTVELPITPGPVVYDGANNTLFPSYYELTAQIDPALGDYWLEDVSVLPTQTSPKNRVGLINANWRTSGNTLRRYFTLPESRGNHFFTMVQTGAEEGTYVAKVGRPEQWVDFDVNGNRIVRSYGFVEAWAEGTSASADFYLVDRTSKERSPTNQTNLVSATWTSDTSSYPTHTVTILVPVSDIGRSYTLYALGGGAQELRAQVYPPEMNYYAAVTGIVGAGMEFWLKRNEDQIVSPHWQMGTEDLIVYNSGFPTLPPLQVVSPTTVTFLFDYSTRFNHSFVVMHANGLRVLVNVFYGSPDGYINTYDTYGNVQSQLAYTVGTADVDDTQAWWLVDESNSFEVFPPKVRNVFDGGWPINPPPPAQALLRIPSERVGRTLYVRLADGTEWAPTYTGISGYQEWYDSDGQLVATTGYDEATAWYDPNQSWELIDYSSSPPESIGGEGNVGDFATWLIPQPLSLSISATRWSHALYLDHPLFGFRPIVRGSIEGAWYLDSNGDAHFNEYGIFSATTTYFPQLPWRIWDASTDEAGNGTNFEGWISNDVSLDEDQDGIPDWFERILGTSTSSNYNENNVMEGIDTDNDGVSDLAELEASRNPVKAAPSITILSPGGATLN